MLFLVFDLELVLLLPLSVTLNSISTYGFWVAVLFFVILTVGFVLEIGTGAISLNSSFNNNNNNLTPFLHSVRPKKQGDPSPSHP
jgi:NADH-ubiquinone oxidoreductase chain 3